MIWPPGQSIGFIKSTWFVNDCEVKLGQEEGPAGLPTGQFLLCMEIGEVVVVGPNFENLGMSFEVMSPVFEGFDDGKEFFIMNIVRQTPSGISTVYVS